MYRRSKSDRAHWVDERKWRASAGGAKVGDSCGPYVGVNLEENDPLEPKVGTTMGAAIVPEKMFLDYCILVGVKRENTERTKRRLP